MTGKVYRFLAIAGVLGVVPALAQAQGTTISGQVTGTGGAPIVGASVSIPALRVGGFTDDQGHYTFVVPASATGTTVTLTARRLGFSPSSASVPLAGTAVSQNFSLSPTATELTGVVVTALGLTREKSRLGTAQQQLTSAEINQTKAMSVVDQLAGKVSGVTITGSGTQGGSSNIVIRGSNSITGSNQPLFIVDGVALNNRGRGTGSATNGGDPNGGWDFGSGIADINPDDIATMSVLKGPNAAALYGSRAANGVIVISTKKGSSSGNHARVELNTTYTWDTPSILPTYQNLYGQGAGGEFDFVDGAGGGVNDGLDQSFGPRLDGRTTGCVFVPKTTTYDTSVPCHQFNAVNGAPWIPQPDNVSSFFDTGHTRSTTIAFSGGNDRASARVSLGRDNITGYVPNNNFGKTSGLLNGSIKVSDRLTTDATLQYIKNGATNRPGTGYNNGLLETFVWFGRQVDMNALRNYQLGGASNGGPANREFNWNYNYHNNPFWVMNENPLQDQRDRFLGSVSATYKLLDGVNLIGQTGSDIYRFNVDQRFGPQNIQGNGIDPNYFGGFDFVNDYSNDNSSSLLMTANRDLNSRLNVNATFGGSNRSEIYDRKTISTTGISVAGIYNVGNAAVTPTLGQFDSHRQVKSIFGAADFTAFNWLTLGGTARNDWSSTLPIGHNSYFYPSGSIAAVLTDALPSLKNSVLSYAKIRASMARVGNDADPYQLRATYPSLGTKFGGRPQFSLQNFIANPDLKPENTDAKELGLELNMLDGRVTFDFSWYDKATKNQIFTIPISPTSGFQSKALNAGKITNKGIDFLLAVTPIQTAGGAQWTSTFNFSKNKSMVNELAPGIDTYVIGTSWYTNIEARAGQPYGSIYGYAFARDSATGKIYTDGGYTVLGGRQVLGNIQPNWTGGWNNTITYKNMTLGGLIDVRRGGNIVSVTNFFGDYAGVTAQSLKGREVDWNKPGVVVDGIDINTCAATGPCNGSANTTNITSEQYFQNIFPVMEPYVYKDDWVKLRELRFGVDLPAAWASMVNARAVNVSLVGRNLHTWTKVPNIDPEFSYTVGNFQGIEFAALPNARTIGLSFRITP
ncbi:MAG: SusC/RagA family TonB-linked outer membrane protein [Gemmatimonadaceae bacterium]